MLGEEMCLFRGANGDVVAIQDVCPHRGARLSEGHCHYRGTVACPYHGWVFDESGKNVAVLSEGPDSGVCGKPGTEAKAYPTRTLKGVVFVWIGDGDPAPIEEDVPEEFFDDQALILTGQVYWRCNWGGAPANSMGSHLHHGHPNAPVWGRPGLHAHVRARRGEADPRVVLPLPAAPERAGAALAARALLRAAPLDHRVQLLAPGRARDAPPALRHAGKALGDGRRGDPVAPARRDQALRRARRAVRVQEPRRAGAGRGAAQPRLRALSPGGAAGQGATLMLSRRQLVLGGAAAALARPARAAAQPAEWSALVAAAKKEGKVVVNTFPGDGYARALKPFTQAYPEIKIEQMNLHSQDFAPRILQERQANIFTWDLALIPTSTALQVLRPAGVWDPVRPAIVLPEAKDDAGWEGGFERGFALVKDRALTYGFVANRGGGITINTDVVKEEQIRRLVDLLDPRWKGKLLLPDVRTMGDAFWPMTAARLNLGDDIIKRLFVDQEPVLSRDTRQIAEFMVRGRFPVALGVNPLILKQFQRQGLGTSLKLFHFAEMDTQNSTSSTLWLLDRAPHPNAA